jgi:hypothetical protein
MTRAHANADVPTPGRRRRSQLGTDLPTVTSIRSAMTSSFRTNLSKVGVQRLGQRKARDSVLDRLRSAGLVARQDLGVDQKDLEHGVGHPDGWEADLITLLRHISTGATLSIKCGPPHFMRESRTYGSVRGGGE